MKKVKRARKINSSQIEIGGVMFNLLQKRIKNLHLRIYPPHGEVRISAPSRLSLEAIKKFVFSKLNWIKEQQIKIINRKRIAPLKFISGENHNFFGKKYRLQIIETKGATSIHLKDEIIEIHVKKSADAKKLLEEFYRREIKKIIPHFIARYERKMQVKVVEFGVKKMKTRWGTCNPKAQRIWLNLELAKRNIKCLEFIVVHEMTHLLERKHSKKFFALMDKFMPDWRVFKEELANSI